MKRKLAWVCLLVSPLVVGGAVFYIFWERDAITKSNFDKIKDGMTLRQVVSILGKENLCRDHNCSKGDEPDFVWSGSRAFIAVYCRAREEPAVPDKHIPRWPIDDDYLTFWGDVMLVRGASFHLRDPNSLHERIRKWLNL
jgi:hypothetical protein